MDKWNLEIDVARCMNCNNCVVATKDEFSENEFDGYSRPYPRQGDGWMTIERYVRGSGSMIDSNYKPVMCNHCDDAPCIKAAGDGAIYKRPDGIVMIDPVKCQGRKDLVETCPYGAINWNEEENVPQAWFFDAHLLDQGLREPRCVQACPTEAMKLHRCTDKAMSEYAAANGLEVLQPELGTRPRVYYKNLYKCHSSFIGGTILAVENNKETNVLGCHVRLLLDGEEIAAETSDEFGEFRFDGLDEEKGRYLLKVSKKGYKDMSVMLEGSATTTLCIDIQLDHVGP